jgi:maltose/maltodextrin transport system substrate-binding protein
LASLVAAVALGCGSSAFAVEEGKLLVWINGDKGYRGLQQVGDKFAEDLGVPVTVEIPEDAPGKFQKAAAVGKGPDIFIWAHDRAGEWVKSGLLNPVEPSAGIKESVSDVGWEAFTIGGRLWGYPIAYEAVGLVYNKDLVPEPPATFDEVMALDKTLSEGGKKAILWDYTNTYFTWGVMAANGGYVFGENADGSVNVQDTGVNNDGAVQGVQLVVDMIDSGVMPRGASYTDMEKGVNAGEIAMMINGPWSWGNLKQSGINFGVAPIPAVGSEQGRPFIGVLGAMINRASPNKDLAKEFLEGYLLQVEGLSAVNADVPIGVPANVAFYEELAADDPNIQGTMANVQLGSPMPSAPEMGRFWSAMASALENATQGRQSVKEALDAAAERIVE